MKQKRVLVFAGLFVASASAIAWAALDDDSPRNGDTPSRKIVVAPTPIKNSTQHHFYGMVPVVQDDGSTREVKVDQLSIDATFKLHEILASSTKLTKRVTVVNREQLAGSMAQLYASKSGLYSMETRLEFGKLLMANTLVLAELTHISFRDSTLVPGYRNRMVEVSIAIQVFKPETGETKYARTFKDEDVDIRKPDEDFDDKDLIIKALRKALEQLAADETFVAALSN